MKRHIRQGSQAQSFRVLSGWTWDMSSSGHFDVLTNQEAHRNFGYPKFLLGSHYSGTID